MKKIIVLIIAGITAGTIWACPSPSNIEGVAFTSQESIDLTKFKSLGTNDTQFLRDSSDAGIAVRYRSHYSNDAMVFVGSYGLSYQQSLTLNCMGIIVDPDKFEATSLTRSNFYFADAVRVELLWMREQGIITIDNETITAIFDSLDKSSNGGVQYWTLQKHVLGYNSWYDKDTQSGVWGVDNVNSVRSVKAATCAGINAEYKAFTQSIDLVGVKNLYQQSAQTFRITKNTATSLTIIPWSNIDNVKIVTTSGKFCPVHINAISGGVRVSFNSQISPGFYFLKLGSGAAVHTIPVVIGR
ncbi:MAG: hypothetical protein GX639_20330 [Fibrobacter sp.]|nr:hypothetical protein [Fibrobacter sp.]